MVLFQSTLSARGATQTVFRLTQIPLISIHALREGSDVGGHFQAVIALHISIHALREGSDDRYLRGPLYNLLFQSTLSARGATGDSLYSPRIYNDFNPRSPRGERRL